MVYLNLQIQQIADGLIAAGYSLGELPVEAMVAVSDTAPPAQNAGLLWFSTVTNILSIYNGITWQSLGLTADQTNTLSTLSNNVYTASQVDNIIAGVEASITSKQDTLVSGTNIKTVNGVNIVGSGNATIQTQMGSIDELADVTTTLPTNGQLLSYNSTLNSWVNTNQQYGSINDLSDTTITSATNGQVLTWNGTEWVNSSPTSGVTDHTLLTNIGTNTHAQIDTALTRLANTSGTNTGDQDLSGYSLTSHNHSGVYEPANANIAKLNVAQTFTSAQRGSISTITYGATITPDFSVANNFQCTITGNVTVANPTNIVAGQMGKITLIQDATGGRTTAWGSYYKFGGGTLPTYVTTANSKSSYYYEVASATDIIISPLIDWK